MYRITGFQSASYPHLTPKLSPQQRVGNESLTIKQTQLLELLDTAQSWLKKIPNWSNNPSENEAFFTFFSTFYAKRHTFLETLTPEEQNQGRIKTSISNFDREFILNTQSFYQIYYPILEQKLNEYKTYLRSQNITTSASLYDEMSKIASWRAPLQTLTKDLIGPAQKSLDDIFTKFQEIKETLLPPRRRS